LLKTFDARGDHRKTDGGHGSSISQQEAAEKAGLSEHKQLQAVRVANVPRETFEALVESEDPPTVTKLAEMGKRSQPKPPDLDGIDPHDFRVATDGQDRLGRLAEFAQEIEPAVRGLRSAKMAFTSFDGLVSSPRPGPSLGPPRELLSHAAGGVLAVAHESWEHQSRVVLGSAERAPPQYQITEPAADPGIQRPTQDGRPELRPTSVVWRSGDRSFSQAGKRCPE
jgi:hypothetical protein